MNRFITVCVFMCILGFKQNVYGALPDYFKVCMRNDPNISNCIKDSIISLRQKLSDGIPDLAVPAFEPFILDKIILRDNVMFNLTDLIIKGISSYEIMEFKAEVAKNRFAFVLKVPKIDIFGDYELDMKLLLLQLKGTGKITANLSNYIFSGILKGRKNKVDDKVYLKFDHMKLGIIKGASKLKLDNLFNGDKMLGDVANMVINENSDLFLNEIIPPIESALAEKLTVIANTIMSQFTYDELFPLNP